MKTITLKEANKVIKAAIKRSEDTNVLMNIAVVDAGNNLLAFSRMDGAWLGSIDIALNKAYTSRSFNMSTKVLAPLCQSGQPLFGIHASNQGRLIVFAGGIPIMDGNEVVGAIGVSGGSVEQDHDVAEAGVAAY